MKGPWRVLSVHGSLHIFHFLWPDPNRNNYWLFFCILCNTNGIKGHWGHKGPPLLGQGPALVLQWTLPWPYNTLNMALYVLAIFLHSMQQKWDQGTLGNKNGPSLGPGPALVLQWSLLWPNNTPNMALYIASSICQI